MKEICIRSREEVLTADLSEISEDHLFQLFIKKPAQAVYVTVHDKVIGMITLGDFERNQLDGRRLITTEFTRVGLSNEEDAVNILNDKEWMDSLPVLNDNGQVVKEYFKSTKIIGFEKEDAVIDDDGKESFKNDNDVGDYIFEVISQIICEVNYLGTGEYEKILCLTDLLNVQQIRQLQQKSTEGRVEVADSISVTRIRQCADENTCICDIFPKASKVKRIFYQKFGVDSVEWDIKESELQAFVTDRACHFKAVAVFENEKDYFQNIIKDTKISILEEKSCKWKDEQRCFEYTGDFDQEAECVFVFVSFLEKTCVIARGGLERIRVIYP